MMTRRYVKAAVAALVLALPIAPAAKSDPIDPAKVSAARKSVVVVLPRWHGVRPGFAPRSAGRRIAPEGSGIAILPGGYIATNDHVLGNPVGVWVRLEDGRWLPATIVGRHKQTDIALLKIDADLSPFTDAPAPLVASPACAIGNPFGRGLSVSCGVVSAVGRSNAGFNEIEDFIQTDAAVNPGGSGGALVDGGGRLLGMVSAIFAQGSDVNLGVNFAASTPLLRRVVEDLKSHGRVIGGTFGIEAGDAPAAQQASKPGIAVQSVEKEGPAFKAGIEAGDVISRVGKRAVRSKAQFRAAEFLLRPGDNVSVTYSRGGKTFETEISAAPLPAR